MTDVTIHKLDAFCNIRFFPASWRGIKSSTVWMRRAFRYFELT